MKKRHIYLLVLVFSVMFISGCYHADTQQTQPTEPMGEVTKEVTVDGSEFSFSPSTLTVSEGDVVKVTFNNVGNTNHNFGINEFRVRSRTISAGSSDEVIFTADKSGTFSFDCSIPGHRSAGMEGQINII